MVKSLGSGVRRHGSWLHLFLCDLGEICYLCFIYFLIYRMGYWLLLQVLVVVNSRRIQGDNICKVYLAIVLSPTQGKYPINSILIMNLGMKETHGRALEGRGPGFNLSGPLFDM